MRVGILAPITHPFPPPGYGPWERVAFDLTESLVALGHDITVFAAEGSITSAQLWPTAPAPLEGRDQEPRLVEQLHIARAMEAGGELDIEVMHSHLHVHALAYSRLVPFPVVSTLHGAAWHRPHHEALLWYRDQPFVSISDSERAFLPELAYIATVYNGIALEDFPFQPAKEDYLVFAGRLAPEKAPDLAIAAAQGAGIPLRLAGRVEAAHREFFDREVAPHLGGGIDYLGELPRVSMRELIGGARALLMPLRWEEPFGLVVAEAMACGTPVVAWNRGAMGELIDHGQTGYLVGSVEEAAAAVKRLDEIDPVAVRRHADARFSREVMAQGYVDAYGAALRRPSRRR